MQDLAAVQLTQSHEITLVNLTQHFPFVLNVSDICRLILIPKVVTLSEDFIYIKGLLYSDYY